MAHLFLFRVLHIPTNKHEEDNSILFIEHRTDRYARLRQERRKAGRARCSDR